MRRHIVLKTYEGRYMSIFEHTKLICSDVQNRTEVRERQGCRNGTGGTCDHCQRFI